MSAVPLIILDPLVDDIDLPWIVVDDETANYFVSFGGVTAPDQHNDDKEIE